MSVHPNDTPAFTRAEFEVGEKKLLRDGRAANACVYLFRHKGKEWTVKDFSSRSWAVRLFLTPFLFWRELKALRALHGIDGVPDASFRVDKNAIAIQFIPGTPVMKRREMLHQLQFLQQMEELLIRVHKAGMVHLDARGTGNWVVMPDGRPGLIDFQAGICTRQLPAGLRRILEDVDISGILKKRNEFLPDTMDAERLARLERGSRIRSLWKLRGYFGTKKKPSSETAD